MNDAEEIKLTAARSLQPRVGISACLNGEQVRYDGAAKTSETIRFEIAPWVNLVSFCPEVSAGLGVPRPPVDLIKDDQRISALGVHDASLDVTRALQSTSETAIEKWGSSLSAYIVKARSPSCGAGTTPLYDHDHHLLGTGDGIFVAALKKAFPELLIVDEESFTTPEAVKDFLQHCYRRHQAWLDAVRHRPALA